uniref:Bromo domain-containing protein n=1 Tax=Parastrongyloides trichosuri TaxID=131310 RepID=A0A0N4ZWS5_PARTI
MLDNFEGKLKQLESNNIQRPASSILINSTQIVMPPLSHSGKYNISGRLLLLFEIERKKKLLMEKLIEKKESSKLQITTPLENTNLVFQTRQEGLKIRIIPENSTGIVQTKLSDVQETTTKNDDETLTIQNIPLSLLLKLVQSNQIKAENEKTTTTTTTVKPKSEDLNSEVLNLQKQLLLALLKEKTESNKDSSLSSISNETLLKLFSNTEQKTTTTTTPEPTTRQHVVLELPKEVLQLFVNSNKESNIEEKDKKSKELSKDDERISLSVVTLLKLLTANRKDENKFKSEEIVPSKNITITSSYKNSHLTTKTLKTTTIKSKDKTYEDNSDEDLIVKSTTKKSNFDNISESKESSEYGIVSSEELTEKPKTTVTTRIKLKKFQTRITKIMSSEENSNNSNESIEVKKKTRITKRHSKASAVTLPLSSNSEELIDTTTMKTSHSRRRRKKNRNSQKHTTLPGTKKNNRRRGKKRKGILDGFNGSQFIMNLIPKLKESFGIEPQIHPLERKINSTTIKSDELLDK